MEEASKEDTQMLCFNTFTAFPSDDDCHIVAIKRHNDFRQAVMSREIHQCVGISLVTLPI
jgi:hypothetical protein